MKEPGGVAPYRPEGREGGNKGRMEGGTESWVLGKERGTLREGEREGEGERGREIWV
jgi:hypothetical protein